MEYRVVLDNVETHDTNGLKRNKNRMTLRVGNSCKVYPLFKGINYETAKDNDNGKMTNIICVIAFDKINDVNKKRLKTILVENFKKVSIDSMYNQKSCDDFSSCLLNRLSKIKYVYPTGYVPLGKSYLDNAMNLVDSIKFKRKQINMSIVLTKVSNIYNVSNKLPFSLKNSNPNLTHYNYKGDSLRKLDDISNTVIYVSNDFLSKLHKEIDKTEKPNYIWVLLTTEEFDELDEGDHKKLFNMGIWSKDCMYCGKTSTGLIDVITINEQSVPIKDLLSIRRHKISLNKVETKLLNSALSNEMSNEDILGCYESMNFVDTDAFDHTKKVCNICMTRNTPVITKCKHSLCINCIMTILMSADLPKCPYCRSDIKYYDTNVETRLTPSYFGFILSTVKRYKKPIIYVRDINMSRNICKLLNENNITALTVSGRSVKDLNADTNSHSILVALDSDDATVRCVRGIDAIICKSDNDDIITNCRYYGKDFIDEINKVRLDLYSYDI